MLLRLTEVDALHPQKAFAERLSDWLGWTDAISLSAALNARPQASLPATQAAQAVQSAETGKFIRMREALVGAISEDSTLAQAKGPRDFRASESKAPRDPKPGSAPYHRRYAPKHQAMDPSVGALRGQLRAALSEQSPEMARLAAVDTAMEQVLGERERGLLTIVPLLLERHFERSCRGAQAQEGADPQDEAQAEARLDSFRKDMQALLLAELDFRLQPADGLLDALRSRP